MDIGASSAYLVRRCGCAAGRWVVMSDMVGEGIRFERIRRITGYLVGTVDRFNDAKRAEVNDRVKHGTSKNIERI